MNKEINKSNKSEKLPDSEAGQPEKPKRILFSFDMSAEEALEAVKAHFGIGEDNK